MDRPRGRQEFLKIGPRNAMVISMAGLALVVDRDARAVRCALGRGGGGHSPGPRRRRAWVAERISWDNGAGVDDAVADEFGSRVAAASSPIDDHRSTAAYRRHAVAVLATRALKRAFAEGGGGDA